MTENGNKPNHDRRHQRFSIGWTVEIKATAWADALQLVTGDISRGGLFIRCPETIESGTRLEIQIQLPDGTRLAVEGEVVHNIAPERAESEKLAAGFGVRFDEKHSIDLNLLEAIASSNAAGEGRRPIEKDTYVTLPTILFGMETDLQMITTAHHLVDAEVPQEGIDIDVDEMLGDAELGASTAVPHQAVPVTSQKGKDPPSVFGIDFGTSYSNIALVQGNAVEVICGDDGHNQIPSVVSWVEQGPPLVGWAAREQLALSPATTIVSPKRLIGRRYDDPKIDPFLAATPVPFERGPDGMILAEIQGDMIAMPQVCAALFRHLSQLAEEKTGIPVQQAVLSAPVGLQREREAIKRAAQIAGIEVLQILDEPVAAALAYGLTLTGEQLVAVYDFGGGTFDFSLLRVKDKGGVEVIGTAGDPWLGGDDFDLALANHVADAFWRHKKIDLRARKAEWQRLLFHVEMAKIRLSVEQQVKLEAKSVALSLRGPIDLKTTVSRDLLHHICHEYVERSIDVMEGCLNIVGVKPNQIDHVVLTGGTSRSPQVRARLQQYFDRELSLKVDPDLAIVTGNAVYGRFVTLGGAQLQV